MWFDPATGAGYVLLTNSGVYLDDQAGTTAASTAMAAMNHKLMDLAHALP